MDSALIMQGECKGARTGKDFLRRLSEHPPELWYRGERVARPHEFGPLKNGINTIAGLYDHQWTRQDLLIEQMDGRPVSRSFSIPRNKDELRNLGKALIVSAEFSHGMLGREPAYLNRSLAAFAGSSGYFDIGGSVCSDKVTNYFRFARDNDLALTHTLLNPRGNRRVGPAFQSDPTVALHVERETHSGFFVSGSRLVATLPFADELAVFPSRLMDMSEASRDYALAFVIPTCTPGVKFICRDSIDYGLGVANHPLSARYEEMDSVAIFKDVFVPWERVFCYRDINICNHFYDATGATGHISYQVVCKNIVKIEFLLGLISLMIRGSGLETFQHIHEKMADVWVSLQTMRAFKAAAEAGAHTNEFGLLVPDWNPLSAARYLFPKMYPKLVEVIQQIGASGLVILPTREDLEGPLRDEIKKYFVAANLEAEERIDLYRLAWDASVSAFAGRQVLYERFFFGDPVHMASRIFRENRCADLMERVNHFVFSSRNELAT